MSAHILIIDDDEISLDLHEIPSPHHCVQYLVAQAELARPRYRQRGGEGGTGLRPLVLVGVAEPWLELFGTDRCPVVDE